MSSIFKGSDEVIQSIPVPKRRALDPKTGELFKKAKPKKADAKPSTILIDLKEMISLEFDLDRVQDMGVYVSELRKQVKIEEHAHALLSQIMTDEQKHYSKQALEATEARLKDAQRFQSIYNQHSTELKTRGSNKEVAEGFKYLMNQARTLK
jgi:hypothetical protein